jgi:hypothetical protein
LNFYQKNVQKFYIVSQNFYTKRGCRKTVYVLYFVADVKVTGIFFGIIAYHISGWPGMFKINQENLPLPGGGHQ